MNDKSKCEQARAWEEIWQECVRLFPPDFHYGKSGLNAVLDLLRSHAKCVKDERLVNEIMQLIKNHK